MTPLNRSTPINGRVAALHSEGARFVAHRPVAPQRHRERTDIWTEPTDGPPWIETAALWLAGSLTAVGIGLAVYCLTVLAMVAGS